MNHYVQESLKPGCTPGKYRAMPFLTSSAPNTYAAQVWNRYIFSQINPAQRAVTVTKNIAIATPAGAVDIASWEVALKQGLSDAMSISRSWELPCSSTMKPNLSSTNLSGTHGGGSEDQVKLNLFEHASNFASASLKFTHGDSHCCELAGLRHAIDESWCFMHSPAKWRGVRLRKSGIWRVNYQVRFYGNGRMSAV